MKVLLADLKPNPYRDYQIDPIDRDVVAQLRASIEEDGFWGGVVCRQMNGDIQIGAGHHRIIAAMEAGIEESDVFVTKDMSDAAMIRVYARENATQRGNSGNAQAGMIASAIRYIARAILTEEFWLISQNFKEPGAEQPEPEQVKIKHAKAALRWRLTDSDKGIGRDVIEESGLLAPIPGINEKTIRQQLANLKASGNYGRIIAEVEADLEREHQEALAALEASERERARLERERQEAEKRQQEAEKEQKEAQARARAARQALQEKRAAEEAQKEKLAQERARIQQELAEKRRADLIEERKKFEALTKKEETIKDALPDAKKARSKAEDQEKTFDFEGVSKHIKNAYQLDVFRNIVMGAGVKPYLPVEKQAELAQYLVELAHERNAELTGVFLRENAIHLLLQGKEGLRHESKQMHERLMQEDLLHRASHYQLEFVKYIKLMRHSALQLEELYQKWPKEIEFPLSENFRKEFHITKEIFDRLTKRFP